MPARILLASALAACALTSYGQAIPSSQTAFGPVVKWGTVAQGINCAITNPEWRVIGSQAEWNSHFRRMFNIDPRQDPEVPYAADWNKEMVVAIHAGLKPSAGYGVYVSTINRPSTFQWEIQVVLQEPHMQSRVSDRETSPWVVIRVERTTGTPIISSRVVRSNVIVINQDDPYGGCRPPQEVPIWMVGQGGKLIPMNDVARRALGEKTDKDKEADKGKKKGGG